MTYEENSDTQETGTVPQRSVVRFLAACIVLCFFLAVPSGAQTANHPFRIAVKNNMAYQLALAPNIGVEVAVANKFTVTASATYIWNDWWPWYEHVRVLAAEAELRYWTAKGDDPLWRGLHVGPYAAVYRYDFLFGSKGQQAKANWGAGLSCGYSVPVDRYISFDFSLSLGYVGGKYKEYEPVDDIYHHNVWMADKKRNYWGPTKAEISFVWHIGGTGAKMKRGGDR